MARLKVFSAPMGFYEAIVAAPSQKAALSAWGVQHNLFADGAAAVTDAPDAVAAALARPGVVLRRPLGGGPIEDASAPPHALPEVPDLQTPRRARRAPTAAAARPKPPPDRSKLDAAETALADREAAHARAVADLDRREAVLRADRQRVQRAHDDEIAELRRRVEQARRAYERAAQG